MELVRKSVAEYLGAFAIVFAGCGAAMLTQLPESPISHFGVSIAFGLAVMVMIYSLGHISGAHFNPAVTLAFMVTRNFPKKNVVPYWSSQVLGAISASLLHKFILIPALLHKYPDIVFHYGITQPINDMFFTAFWWELILTFLLMFIIVSVATDTRAVGELAGIAIGATVTLEALFAGPVCGASMNPARSIGPALISGELSHLAAYIVGPILGAVLGAFAYRFICCGSKERFC